MARQYLVKCSLGALFLATGKDDAIKVMKKYITAGNIGNMSMGCFEAEEYEGRYFVPNIQLKTIGVKSHDEVNSPNHYCKGNIECIDVIKAATEGLVGMEAVCTANIIKYIFRWKDKNGTVDVKKCEWYIKRLIKELESNNEAI